MLTDYLMSLPNSDQCNTYCNDVNYQVQRHSHGRGRITRELRQPLLRAGYDRLDRHDPRLTKGDRNTNADADQTTNPSATLNPYRIHGQAGGPDQPFAGHGARRFGPDISRFLQRDQYAGAFDDPGLQTVIGVSPRARLLRRCLGHFTAAPIPRTCYDLANSALVKLFTM
jgi:hypothetical protein